MAEAAEHHEHILPLRVYINIGLTLLALTIITIWVAQYDLGEWNLIVAMVIAMTKGTLVAMFFMHLKYTNKLYSVAFIGALLMLGVFIILTMFDTMTRGELYSIEAKPISDEAVIYRHDTTATADSTADTAGAVETSTVDSEH